MLRLFTRTTTAGGAAAGLASLPGVAECHHHATTASSSQQVTLPRKNKGVEAVTVAPCDSLASQMWLSPEFKDGEVLAFEEVQDALDDVLSVAASRARTAGDSGDDCSSVESFGADADQHIEHFDLAVAGARPQLTSVMHTLLNNEEVQRAVVSALKDSPEFDELLNSPELEVVYAANLLLPAAAAVALERRQNDRNLLEKGLEAVAGGLQALGESIAGVGDGIAAFFGRLAEEVRSALHGNTAAAEGSGGPKQQATRKKLFTGALFSLAVAVIALVMFKRARIVRVVRT